MKKYILSLQLILTSLYASQDISLGIGYRRDELNWNIAGPFGEPDVLSELTWSDLDMCEVSFAAMGCLPLIGAYRVNADYAWILHGKNRDSDYAMDHREMEFLRSENNASKGEAFDLKVGIGRSYSLFCETLTVTPLVGVALMEQHLKMYDGNLTVNLIDGFVGHFHGLNSSYNTRWESPWAGIDLIYAPDENLTFYGSAEYHWPYYKAKGHWNLRSDFIGDFIHKGNGHGVWFTLAGNYAICSGFNVGLSGEAAIFKVKNGTDTTKFLDQSAEEGSSSSASSDVVKGRARLNAVNWRSYRILLTGAYSF